MTGAADTLLTHSVFQRLKEVGGGFLHTLSFLQEGKSFPGVSQESFLAV